MDPTRFDALTRRIPARLNRRTGLRLVATLGLLGAGAPNAAGAKKKKACPPCKKRKKGKCKGTLPDGTECAGGTCQAGSCLPVVPPPPPPLPTGPGNCQFVVPGSFQGSKRWAQTFLPPYSGALTSAEFYLRKNPANFSLSMQIRPVDSAGTPTATILAFDPVTNIGATALADPPHKISAVFAPPAAITVGQRYALAIVSGTNNYSISATGGNPCPDGALFHDQGGSGVFKLSGVGTEGMDFAVAIDA